MRTRVSWWTERSIEWFERASSFSDYHERLCDIIMPYLSGRITEAGCGLGYEARILHGRGADITAFDRDASVIERARAASGLGIFRCMDFSQLSEIPDVLLCINFAHMESRGVFDNLMAHAEKRLVYVLSRHTGPGKSARPDRSALVEHIVRESGFPYERLDFTLQFDQPLRSLDEARAFIEWTYPDDDMQVCMQSVVENGNPQYPYVFRNSKNLVLFTVDKGEGK
ncbi:MAG: methyltransferase domain-containing protein [Spirochaetales bacterium]|nr:methyltransferase domain-containing protein [Spirochaetales bacterium]